MKPVLKFVLQELKQLEIRLLKISVKTKVKKFCTLLFLFKLPTHRNASLNEIT
jgi:hypothetical protein